jgi:hypothetical protein
MSIMTSLYPSSHGVLKKNNRLADEHLTLAELLREGGYKTAAFADGAFMKGDYGFKQGFDLYDGDKWIGIKHILPKAKKWLEGNKANPFFLFIHCYDIHDPYTPPPPYDTIFHDFTYTGNFTPTTKNMQAAAWRGLEVNDEDLRHIKALYDGGIRYTDEKIGEFLSYLQEAGLIDDSLIIITSDHGEEFKEHGSFLHWKLYFRPNLHVPLIMHIPNYQKKEIRIKELVQSIDILPTILDSAQLPPHPNAQGASLLPLIKQNSTFLRRSWWRISHSFRKEEKFSFAEREKEKADDYSIIKDNYQLIYDLKSKSMQLYNIKNDPLSQENIVKGNDIIVQKLFSQLNQFYSMIPEYKAETFILDEQTIDQLQALGYIDEGKDNFVCLDDVDCDGIDDNNDNCPSIPNGSSLGTCLNCNSGTTGETCKKREDCDIGYLCGMKQENICRNDFDNDGIINNEDNCICMENPMQADTYPPGGNNCGDSCDCIGNLDKDDEVGIRDITLFNRDLGRKNCTQQNPCNGDFDCDGDVDDADYLILKTNIGGRNCAACEVRCSYE